MIDSYTHGMHVSPQWRAMTITYTWHTLHGIHWRTMTMTHALV